MSKFRKILVAAVVLSMVLSLVGTGFAAAPKVVTKVFSDTEGKDCEEAMAMLGGLGIYKGDSGIGGPARPDDPITRAEVSAVVTRMLGKEKTAKAMENYAPPFVDAAQIPSWAWGYVSVASSLGIVKGYPDGSFKAGNNVTHAEMLAMLVRALGHDSLVKGVWPTNYIVYGHSLGLTDGVEVFANLPATRGEVAMMAANAMEADVYDEVAGEELKGKSLLTGELRSGFESVEGTVTDVNMDKAEITIRGDWDNDDDTADTVGKADLASQVVLVGIDRLENLKNLDVKAVLVSDKVVYIEVIEEAEIVTGILEDVQADIDEKEIILDGEDDYDLADDVEFYINGTKITEIKSGSTVTKEAWENFRDSLNAQTPGDDDIKVKLTLGENADGDKVVKIVEAEIFDLVDDYITDIDVDDDEDDDLLGTLDLDSGETVDVMEDTEIIMDGEASSFDDLDEDVVVYVATQWEKATDGSFKPGSKGYKIEAYSDSITGEIDTIRKVTTGSGKGYWKVTLVLSDDSTKTIRLSENLVAYDQQPGSDLTVGATVTLVLNADGYGRVVAESKGGEEVVYVTGLTVDDNDLLAVSVERSGEDDTIDTDDETDWWVVDDVVYARNAAGDGPQGNPLFAIGDFVELKLTSKGKLTTSVKKAELNNDFDAVMDGDGVAVYRVTATDSEVVVAEYTLTTKNKLDKWSASKILSEKPLVYEEEEDGDLKYIGVEGLSQYDKVDVYWIDGDIKAIVKTGEVKH